MLEPNSGDGGNRTHGRSRLKRTPHKPIPGMAEFRRVVTKDGTAGCALEVIQADGLSDCSGRIVAHHFILEQRLPLAAKVDPRVGVPLCWDHHSDVHSAYPPEVPRPPELDDFLKDHGLLESGRPDPKLRAA